MWLPVLAGLRPALTSEAREPDRSQKWRVSIHFLNSRRIVLIRDSRRYGTDGVDWVMMSDHDILSHSQNVHAAGRPVEMMACNADSFLCDSLDLDTGH